MKILKEETIEDNLCPKCGKGLEFSYNERKEKFHFFPWNGWTGNGWFECVLCNKVYLIKDYSREASK